VDKPYLTPEDIAHDLGVTVETVRSWINRKKDPLPAFKIGREWRIRREDFERFISEKMNTRDDEDKS